MTSAWAMPAHADVTESNSTMINSPELTSTPTVETIIEPTIEPTATPTAVPFERYTKMIDGWMTQYIIENEEVRIEKITKESTNTSDILVFPGNIDGYPVREIGSNVLKSVPWINEVELPDTVYMIDETAFNGTLVRDEGDDEWRGSGIKKNSLIKKFEED